MTIITRRAGKLHTCGSPFRAVATALDREQVRIRTPMSTAASSTCPAESAAPGGRHQGRRPETRVSRPRAGRSREGGPPLLSPVGMTRPKLRKAREPGNGQLPRPAPREKRDCQSQQFRRVGGALTERSRDQAKQSGREPEIRHHVHESVDRINILAWELVAGLEDRPCTRLVGVEKCADCCCGWMPPGVRER